MKPYTEELFKQLAERRAAWIRSLCEQDPSLGKLEVKRAAMLHMEEEAIEAVAECYLTFGGNTRSVAYLALFMAWKAREL